LIGRPTSDRGTFGPGLGQGQLNFKVNLQIRKRW
jgi:hypothetical protein